MKCSLKCPLKIKNEDILRVRRFKKTYPEAQDISSTTILGFIDAEKKIKKSIDKKLDKILMIK